MIGSLIDAGIKLIDKIIPDKAAQEQAKLKLLQLEQTGELEMIAAQSKVLVAEAQSESVLTRSWRPLTMLCFVAIIVNNYIIAPYLQSFGLHFVVLPIPAKMWSLLEIGIGGYIMGRSAVQGISAWKNAKK